MEQGMQQQRGAALVIVLALLTGALVVGISGMQSSLIDERLAGNYRASAQAQMNAEQAAAQAVQKRSDYEQSEGKDNQAELGLHKKSTVNAVKQLRYKKVANADLSGKKDGECIGSTEDECFYFPLAIGDDKYWAAFGAVIKEDEVISQHVVLVGIVDHTNESINEDIGTLFGTYLMASGKNSFVEGKDEGDGGSPKVTLDGLMHIEDADQDFKKAGSKVKTGGNYKETRGDTVLGTRLPKFDLDEFETAAKKTQEDGNQRDVVTMGGDDACRNLPQDLGGKVYICKDQQELHNASFSNGTVIFEDQIDFSGRTELKNVNIVATGNSGQITFIDNLFLNNVTVGAKDEIEYNWGGGSGTSRVVNSYFMSESNVQMDFNNNFVVDGGYFYANDESEVEFGYRPNAEPCGSIIGRDQAELYVNHIARFKQCASGVSWW